MRLINADELNELMYHEAFETDSEMQKWDSGCWIRYKMFENNIAKCKPVEAEPKRHGHWIDRADKIDAAHGRHHYQCNICARYLDGHVGGTEDWWDYEAPNYCPNCGAKMNEVEK